MRWWGNTFWKRHGGGILFERDMVGEYFFSEISNNGGGGNLEKYPSF